jgi:glycosyltransferase involved in cell wall biosynthesis
MRLSNRDAASVLMMVENLPVPFLRRVWQEACALRDAGYQVSVICPKGPGFEAARETLEGIEIYRHRVWEASGPLGYLFEYGWALGAEFALALRIFLKRHFRVLHVGNPPDFLFLIGLFFKLFGVRFVYEFLDLSPELFVVKFGKRGLLYRLLCLAERASIRTADAVLAANASYREIAIERGGADPERVFIVRGTPDLRHVLRGPARPELREGRRHLVVYVGVMGSQDGVDLLLETVGYLVKEKKRDDALFALIGAGTELPRLRAACAEKGLDAHVRFTGRISDDELAAYLSTADLGVAPDPKNPMNDKSTMNKILEYMAYARPVVLYDLAEGRRSAEDAALYARPNDPADFGDKILELLGSESLRRVLGERGRKRIEEILNWELSKSELLAAYAKALGASPPSATAGAPGAPGR